MIIKLLLVLLLSLYSVPAQGIYKWEDALMTPQYAIVGLVGCEISTEIKVQEHTCPHFMSIGVRASNNKMPCDDLHAALFLPANKQSDVSPELLLAYKDDSALKLFIQPIILPSKSLSMYDLDLTRHFAANGHKHFVNRTDHKALEEIIGMAYDYKSSRIYMLLQSKLYKRVRCEVYRLDHAMRTASIIADFYVPTIWFSDTKWSSDPYTEKFYYYKQDGSSHGELWSIDFAQMESNLAKGIKGTLERRFEDDYGDLVSDVQVTHGFLYFRNSTHRFLTKLPNEETYKCVLPFKKSSYYNEKAAEYFMILSGWDYCRLRRNASKLQCDEDAAIWKKEHMPDQAETSKSWLIPTITAIVSVNVIVLAIIMCIVCRKRGGRDHRQESFWNQRYQTTYQPSFSPDMSGDF